MQPTVQNVGTTKISRQKWNSGLMLVGIGMLALVAVALAAWIILYFILGYWQAEFVD